MEVMFVWTLKKKIWFILYSIFSKNLPVSRKFKFAKIFRVFFAKHILKKIGMNVNIEKGAYFGPNVSIGDNSGIGVNCELYGSISIGENVLMGPEVVFYTSNHEFRDMTKLIIEQGSTKEKPIIVENDCWIGRRCIILPGVKIAKGTVIGAGSIVTKSFPEYSIIAGNPAKKIGEREKK